MFPGFAYGLFLFVQLFFKRTSCALLSVLHLPRAFYFISLNLFESVNLFYGGIVVFCVCLFPLFPPFFSFSRFPSRVLVPPSHLTATNIIGSISIPHSASAAASENIYAPLLLVPFDRYHHFGGTRTSMFDFFPPKWSGALTSNFCACPFPLSNSRTLFPRKRTSSSPHSSIVRLRDPLAFFRFHVPTP